MKSHRLSICVVAAVALLPLTQVKPDDPGKAPTPASVPMRGKVPGDVRDDNGLKMKLVWCPPGFVTMENLEVIAEAAGDEPKDDKVDPKNEPAAKNDDDQIDDEADPKDEPEPRPTEKTTPVKVFVTKGYWLGKYEVTQSEWKQVMKTEPWKDEDFTKPWKGQDFTKEGADYPATFVSWNDAVSFCRKLTERERQAGRLPNDWEYTLPTEAQWERACRARTETRFNFGDDESKLGDYAWFEMNTLNAGEEYAHRVGQKKGNPWGLCDMHGNVWEWCRDNYTETVPGGRDPEVKSDEKTTGSSRVIRGASWSYDAAGCRSGNRYGSQPGSRSLDLGFRPALSPVRYVK